MNQEKQSAILNLQSAFIQAGGKSSRMGSDKAWIEVEGRPMIERALAAAAAVADQLGVVINPATRERARYEDLSAKWNAHLTEDLHDHRGPLGGIHTALSYNQNNTEPAPALILACDLPFVTADFLSLLIEIHEREANDFTAPVDRSGTLQPLAAIYSPSCLEPVERLLMANRLRVDRLCDLVRTRKVFFEEFAHLPGSERLLVNINSPADLPKFGVS
ncbi:MAG: molybdenum cofactor guanylyltransferase [Blastocatellia bacterium]